MKAINIEDALQMRPFTPFQLHLDNGRSVPVRHPEFLMFSPSRHTVVIFQEDDRFHIVDVDHISSLESL